jgi:hypothetical protein
MQATHALASSGRSTAAAAHARPRSAGPAVVYADLRIDPTSSNSSPDLRSFVVLDDQVKYE